MEHSKKAYSSNKAATYYPYMPDSTNEAEEHVYTEERILEEKINVIFLL